MNNIVQFKIRCAQNQTPITQDVPDYQDFLHSAFFVAECLDALHHVFLGNPNFEESTELAFVSHISTIRAYTQAIPEFQTIKSPR